VVRLPAVRACDLLEPRFSGAATDLDEIGLFFDKLRHHPKKGCLGKQR